MICVFLVKEQEDKAKQKMSALVNSHLADTNATLIFQEGIPAMPLMAADWVAYFPINKVITGRVMELYSSKQIGLIIRKLQQGIANHQEWFKQYAKE